MLRISNALVSTQRELLKPDELRVAQAEAENLISGRPRVLVHTADKGSGFAPGADLSDIYEPEGRSEAIASPRLAEILTDASRRAVAERDLDWGSFHITDWYIFDYGPGQYIIPHADGSTGSRAGWRQLFAISVTLRKDGEGGEFYTQPETFPLDWSVADGLVSRHGLDRTTSKYDYGDYPRLVIQNHNAGDAILLGVRSCMGLCRS